MPNAGNEGGKKYSSWESNSVQWSRVGNSKKIDRDQISLVDLLKRSTMIESPLLIFKKNRPWANCSRQLLKTIFAFRSFLKINGIDLHSSIFEKDRPWANRSRRSLKKIEGSDSIFSRSHWSFDISILPSYLLQVGYENIMCSRVGRLCVSKYVGKMASDQFMSELNKVYF